tara:strand:- start:1056 stop:2717 length:1662 start_codon:yes stop_codon:yes gene_type:complete
MSNPNSKEEEYFIPINKNKNPLTPEKLYGETEPIIIPTKNKNRSVSAPTIPSNVYGIKAKKKEYESEKDLQRYFTLQQREEALSSTLDTNQPTESKMGQQTELERQKRQDRLVRSDNRRRSALTLLMDQTEENEGMSAEDKKGGKRRKTRKSTNKKKNKKTRSKKQKGGISSDEKLLIKAAGEGNKDIVDDLLKRGVNLNLVNNNKEYGRTALMNAIMNEQTEIAKMILEKEPDVNIRNIIGLTALSQASLIGNTEVVKLLLEKGAFVNMKDKYGSTALMGASEGGHTETVLLLLNHGAYINARNKYGDTALNLASVEDHTDTISLLLQFGADVHIQDNNGNTALKKTINHKNSKSSKILQEHIDQKKLEQEQEASRQIQDTAKQIQEAAKYIEKTAEQIEPQHKVPEGLKENLGGNRKTRKSTKPKKNKKTRSKKPQFLYNPNDPKKSFDVYIDKNPDDTITIKYTTVDDVKNTIQKLEKLYKNNKYSHKRIWQVGMIMKVRLEAMLKNKHLYPNAKNVKSRYELSKKYFKFLGKRTQEKDEIKRKKLSFSL